MASRTLNDLWYAWLQSTLPAGVSDGTSSVTPGSASGGVYNSNSLSAVGIATAPGAGAAIATLATPTAGLYEVTVVAHTTATAGAAAEDNNIHIRRAAANLGSLGLARANNNPITSTFFVRVDGTQNISVNATGAATAAVVYSVSLTAKKVSD